jgi:phospholipase/carboxylesterase
MSNPAAPDFVHRFVAGSARRTLLLLHGTGGNEDDLLPIGRALDPEAGLVSPRGKVLENGMPRFFRRLAEGVFDEDDLIRRANELAAFIREAAARYHFDQSDLVAVGYSNGANIAAALLLLQPGSIGGAILLRAMVPLTPPSLPVLDSVPVLIAAGNHDPIVPGENSRHLAELLRAAGADVTVFFEDAGHDLTERTLTTAKRWLAEKT